MVHARIAVTFENAGQPRKHREESVPIDAPRSPQGEEYLAEYLVLELKKEAIWKSFHEQLASISDLLQGVRPSARVWDLSAFKSGINVSRLWFEIGNCLLATMRLLAQARAYKALEPEYKEDRTQNTVLYRIHLKKMEQFDLAVIFISKIEGLILRLIFEGLDGCLFAYDEDDPDWERSLIPRRVMEALRKRSELPLLRSLPDDEVQEVRDVVENIRAEDFVRRFVKYRNSLVHRITPSVDYPEFYVLLETRKVEPILDSEGRQIGTRQGFGATLTEAEYSFLEFYDVTVRTLTHYVSLLRRLKNTPRFA